tara:strand:- start:135 stop:929 length:795 start_codon:yes stop_codon:yes gene_type:complete
LKIFLDSGILDEVREAYDTGIVDGVTTNPSLLKKAFENIKGESIESYLRKILKIAGRTPVSLEVTETSYDGMTKQGLKLYNKFKRSGNVYIKIPINTSFDNNVNFDGIKAIKFFSKKKIPVNVTLIFTPEQALLAAKAGAKIVSPFCGRIDDFIRKNNNLKINKEEYYPSDGKVRGSKLLDDNGVVSGVDLVAQIVEIFDNYDIKCEVLAASMRNARQVRESALAGADIATLPFNVIKELLNHKKTQEGMKNFTKDIVKEYAEL